MPDRKRVTERLMESHYLKSPLHGVGILANGSRSPEVGRREPMTHFHRYWRAPSRCQRFCLSESPASRNGICPMAQAEFKASR